MSVSLPTEMWNAILSYAPDQGVAWIKAAKESDTCEALTVFRRCVPINPHVNHFLEVHARTSVAYFHFVCDRRADLIKQRGVLAFFASPLPVPIPYAQNCQAMKAHRGERADLLQAYDDISAHTRENAVFFRDLFRCHSFKASLMCQSQVGYGYLRAKTAPPLARAVSLPIDLEAAREKYGHWKLSEAVLAKIFSQNNIVPPPAMKAAAVADQRVQISEIL